MKVFRFVKKAAWWTIDAFILFTAIFFVFPRLPYGGKEEKKGEITSLRIWNVDTFEGGKGSRTAFLNRVATEFEKQSDEVLCMVSSKTIEGVKQSLLTGDRPDIISFGVGVGFIGEYCLGEAVPWYRGTYAIFSKKDDFSCLSASNCVISDGGENLPGAAAALEGLSGDFAVEDSTTAYVDFLSGKYLYLLGTQRDACRFSSRGVAVYCRPISAFSDLYGYIAVTDSKKGDLCNQFIKYLISRPKQEELTRLGLMSPYYPIYDGRDEVFLRLERAKIGCTLHPYTSEAVLLEVEGAAKGALSGKSAEELKKFMKFL